MYPWVFVSLTERLEPWNWWSRSNLWSSCVHIFLTRTDHLFIANGNKRANVLMVSDVTAHVPLLGRCLSWRKWREGECVQWDSVILKVGPSVFSLTERSSVKNCYYSDADFLWEILARMILRQKNVESVVLPHIKYSTPSIKRIHSMTLTLAFWSIYFNKCN